MAVNTHITLFLKLNFLSFVLFKTHRGHSGCGLGVRVTRVVDCNGVEEEMQGKYTSTSTRCKSISYFMGPAMCKLFAGYMVYSGHADIHRRHAWITASIK